MPGRWKNHSTKASRRSVLDQIEQALSRSVSPPNDVEASAEQLKALRSTMNKYVHALHDPIEPTSLSPYRAIGRLSLLDEAPAISCKLQGFTEWDDARVRELRRAVDVLARHAQVVYPQTDHVWHGVRLTSASARTVRDAEDLTQQLSDKLRVLHDACEAVTATLSGVHVEELADVATQLDACESLLQTPQPTDDVAGLLGWGRQDAARDALVGDALTPYDELHDQLATRYKLDVIP